jgi:hypothetical protein
VGTGYIQPYTCGCSKDRYEDEDHARAALAAAADHYGPDARVYKCSGYRAWHIATRGFGLEAMKTHGRTLSWYLLRYGYVDFLRVGEEHFALGEADRRSYPGCAPTKGWVRYFTDSVERLVTLGLAAYNPCGGVLVAVDYAGLLRVCEVGLRLYAAERAPEQSAA